MFIYFRRYDSTLSSTSSDIIKNAAAIIDKSVPDKLFGANVNIVFVQNGACLQTASFMQRDFLAWYAFSYKHGFDEGELKLQGAGVVSSWKSSGSPAIRGVVDIAPSKHKQSFSYSVTFRLLCFSVSQCFFSSDLVKSSLKSHVTTAVVINGSKKSV